MKVMPVLIFFIYIGTKSEEYNLHVTQLGNDDFEIEKVAFDPQFVTNAENTVKFTRLSRAKNENLHAAIKQKDQFFDSRIELSYLDELFPENHAIQV